MTLAWEAGSYAFSYEFGLRESAQTLKVNPTNGVALLRSLPPGSCTIDRVVVGPGPTIAGETYLGDSRPRAL